MGFDGVGFIAITVRPIEHEMELNPTSKVMIDDAKENEKC